MPCDIHKMKKYNVFFSSLWNHNCEKNHLCARTSSVCLTICLTNVFDHFSFDYISSPILFYGLFHGSFSFTPENINSHLFRVAESLYVCMCVTRMARIHNGKKEQLRQIGLRYFIIFRARTKMRLETRP